MCLILQEPFLLDSAHESNLFILDNWILDTRSECFGFVLRSEDTKQKEPWACDFTRKNNCILQYEQVWPINENIK